MLRCEYLHRDDVGGDHRDRDLLAPGEYPDHRPGRNRDRNGHVDVDPGCRNKHQLRGDLRGIVCPYG
jgi:hypothetical protein